MSERSPERAPKPTSWYERSLTPDWFRELEATPWGATPLRPYTERQNMVNAELENLFATPYPDDVPADFRALVATDFFAGRAYRETTNAAHFEQWLRDHDGHGPHAHEIIKRREELGIEPAKLLDFIRESDIQAVEIAKLSVPYGYRMEYVPVLRQEIDAIITERGGTLLGDHPYGHMHANLHRSEDFQTLHGILATYQKDVGYLAADDGARVTVTERQALAIRTDTASGFPASLYQTLTGGDPRPSKEAMAEIEQFIQSDLGEKFMVPLSMTLFAHREKPEIREKRAREQKDREREAIARVHLASIALDDTTAQQ